MHNRFRFFSAASVICLAVTLIFAGDLRLPGRSDSPGGAIQVATGAWITPLATPGSAIYKLHTDLRSDDNADASNAVSTALSPDGTTLLVLTSGYNTGFNSDTGTAIVYPVLDPTTGQPTGQTTGNAEWVFVYDVTGPVPIQQQKFNLPVAYNGLVWDASGTKFYVSGGVNDIVYPFKKVAGVFQLDAPFIVLNTGGQLVNTPAGPVMQSFGLAPIPVVAGLALSSDGGTLYAANFENDSVSLVDTTTRSVTSREVFSVPGDKTAFGEYPFWISVAPGKGEDTGSDKVFVSSQRDGQVVVFDKGRGPRAIKVGSEPNKMVLSNDGSRLYVSNGDSDSVSVIDTQQEEVVATINLSREGYVFKGANPNSLALSPDGKTLFVTLGGEKKASLEVIPIPNGHTLAELSEQVDANNGFGRNHDDPVMAILKNKIKHVIYIVKENRTYDQVLGDLGVGNGDPSIVMFPQPVTPNHHKLATEFVTLDNFYCIGEVSGDGWSWSTQARANDYNAKSVPASYGNGFGTLDVWATDRNIVVGMQDSPKNPTQFNARITTLLDPTGSSNILPGRKDIGSVDGDSELSPDAVGGYLWDEAARAGKTLRHYGFYTDYTYYSVPPPLYIPISRTPFKDQIPQGPPLRPTLREFNDIYYRGFDLSVPDSYHYEEWKREFDNYVAQGNLPALEIMSLPLDHFGSFGSNVGGLQTPSLEIVDNDYALGRLVAAVSNSPYWKDTAIFVVEDDAQDGPDHVDAHRSPGYVISAYTKRHAVVHTFYNTINMLRTIEDLLGMNHLGMNDANANPMSDVFDIHPDLTPYKPVLPGSLCQPPVSTDLIPGCNDSNVLRTRVVPSLHDGDWWAKATEQFNFKRPDALDAGSFNRLLWRGIKGEDKPYPVRSSVVRHEDDDDDTPDAGKGVTASR